MRLRISVRQLDGATANVQVTADGTATVHDLAMALACGEDGRGSFGSGNVTLRVLDPSGRGTVLPPEASLLDTGLRSGATAELAHPTINGPRAVDRGAEAAVLRVISGPDAGRETALPIGTSDLGRSATCDVQLTDPLVSKRHARINVGDRVEIVDSNSANGVFVGGERITRTVLGNGDVVTVGGTTFAIAQLRTPDQAIVSTDVAFVRSPRVLARPRQGAVALPDAPQRLRRAFFPWLAMAAPLLLGAIMFAFSRSPQSLLFVLMSPLMMAGAYFGQRVDAKRQLTLDTSTFAKDIDRVVADTREKQRLEVEQRIALYPSVAACVDAAVGLSSLLWSRRPEHPEFLQVRLGLGDIDPALTPQPPKLVGVEGSVEQLTAAYEDLRVLRDAPVVADLRSVGSMGISGDLGPCTDVARAILAQVVILHSPAEVVVCVATSATGKASWSWVEWLPHTASPHSPLTRHLAADATAGNLLVGQLEDLIAARTEQVSGRRAVRGPLVKDEELAAPPLPAVVVVVDGSMADPGRLTRIAELGPDAGVHVVWVAAAQHTLPGACRTFLDVGTAVSPAVGKVRTGERVNPVACEGLDLTTATRVARHLSPVTDRGAPIDDDSDVPRAVPLVSLYDGASPDDPEAVLTGWRENRSLTPRDGSAPIPLDRPLDLRALVGHTGAEKFALDLRTQGPHALVGGTTGAGKSEFLQAWVLGMARSYSPDRVTFLFIDYKGGSAFARCVELPHSVGMVTDLSPYLVQRALRSLRAELRYREHLLNDKGKKDLIELERTGDPDCPPSLIIVVDEFAALVGEVPEFVDGVVDVAQRGRSLGLHLILATQRPAGVIKDNLRANTNLRVALRMADEHDSSDVLGTAQAAHFDPSTPGRAGAKTGPGRITQFQSAYPGSRTPAVAPAPPIRITTLDFGAGRDWAPPPVMAKPAPVASDLDRLTATIIEAARRGEVPPPRKPWLESLAAIYDLRSPTMQQRSDEALILGVLDDPDRQRQVREYFRPDADGNILFYGATGSGKSTALRSLAAAAGILPRGGVVHVYAMDFASGALSSLQSLPHVGAVIRGDDEERIRRLLRWLTSQMDERTQRFSQKRAATLEEYRKLAARPDEPRILILLDGFGAFRAEYEGSLHLDVVYTAFLKVVAEGRALGVHVAVTADRPNAVPSSVASSFLRRVVLRQADDDAYLALGVPRDVLRPSSPPGRAVQVDRHEELQLAIFGGDRSVAKQAVMLEELAASLAPRLRVRPEPVRSLPTMIPADTMPERLGSLPVLGVADETLGPVGFAPSGPILIAGPAQSGKTTALRWFAESLHRAYPGIELIHLAARKTPLTGLPVWRASEHTVEPARTTLAYVAGRFAEPAPEGAPPTALFLENLPAFVDGPLEEELQELVSRARKNGHLVIADGETSDWTNYSPMLREFRSARTGLVLRPRTEDGDNILSTPLPRTRQSDFPVGRGFWIGAGASFKVQIPVAN